MITENQIKDYIKNYNIYVDIISVSQSGMNRKMRFFIVKNNNLISITRFICEECGYKYDLKTHSLRASGCGMNMIFAVLYDFYERLEIKKTSGRIDYNDIMYC